MSFEEKSKIQNPKPKIAICLVSGGMDSCVTAAIAKEENAELAFLHISYGQRTERRERQAFKEIADFYGVEKRLDVSIEYLARIGGSSLTDKNIEVTKADLESKEIPTSYVPFRNANMLAIATSWAEVLGASSIYIGAVAEDSSGYPDCRPEFYAAFEKTIEAGTKPETNIKIRTPIINFSKAEIVRKGIKLDAPLELSWSCYQNEDFACGTCDSCALRLRGFERAGAIDPIPYTHMINSKNMENEKDKEFEEIQEERTGGLAEDISAVGQIIVGELESIGGMLTGDPITRAEGNFNADSGIIREEINQDIAEAEEGNEEDEKAQS